MNIFLLDYNQDKCAKYHNNKHIVKMITEYCQLLSTCLRCHDLDAPYRKTHVNHPCAIWVRQSLQNYQYLWRLADLVGKEYTYRYQKQHLSHKRLLEQIPYTPDIDFPQDCLTDFANCTPYKGIEDTIEAYRHFYKEDKRAFCEWKNRDKPEWFV